MNNRPRLKLGACVALWMIVRGPLAPAGEPSARPSIVIASINIHRELDHGRMIRDLDKSPRLAHPDVLLLQEVEGRPEQCRRMVQGLAHALGMAYLHMPEFPPRGANGDGLVTLSRFPLKDTAIIPLKHFDLVFNTRRRIALVQTVETPFGDIQVFNLHLDTRINPDKRVEQLSTVLDASRSGRPVVIGGDLNTGDYHWVDHLIPVPRKGRQTGAVIERMGQSGFDTPFRDTGPTFDRLGLRLDWFFLRGLRSSAAGIEKIDFSDHHAIWTEVGLP
jgi:endonuclease/exonuclease/phosphatase family metal-dependent hydrolase